MMVGNVDKALLHDVIDTLPQNELEVVYKMFQSFIMDYQDRHLTDDELEAHNRALADDEWYG